MPGESSYWYARPVFFVASCEEALGFYRRLGFREPWRHEEEGRLTAVRVGRSGAELILNADTSRAGGGRLFLSLDRGQVAHCMAAFAAARVEVRDEFWGMPVGSVRDPSGNDLLFLDDDLAAT